MQVNNNLTSNIVNVVKILWKRNHILKNLSDHLTLA